MLLGRPSWRGGSPSIIIFSIVKTVFLMPRNASPLPIRPGNQVTSTVWILVSAGFSEAAGECGRQGSLLASARRWEDVLTACTDQPQRWKGEAPWPCVHASFSSGRGAACDCSCLASPAREQGVAAATSAHWLPWGSEIAPYPTGRTRRHQEEACPCAPSKQAGGEEVWTWWLQAPAPWKTALCVHPALAML